MRHVIRGAAVAVLFLVSLLSAGPVHAAGSPVACDGWSVARWTPQILAASRATSISPRVLGAVILTESGGQPSVVSYTGAIGLMQVEPETGLSFGVQPATLYNPATNIMTGARVLLWLRRYFHGSRWLMLGGYNGGPANPQASYAAVVESRICR